MQLFERIGGLAGADQCKNMDIARCHEWRNYFVAFTVDDVDHPFWKHVAENVQQRCIKQGAVLGGLQDGGVAHNQRRYQGCECFVQRVVERAHAKHHTQRTSTNLADNAFFNGEPGRSTIKIFECRQGIVDIDDGPVKFLYRVLHRFAHFPHEKLDNPRFPFEHPENELFHVPDALSQ